MDRFVKCISKFTDVDVSKGLNYDRILAHSKSMLRRAWHLK